MITRPFLPALRQISRTHLHAIACAALVLLPVHSGAAQFIHLTAEFESEGWDANAKAPPGIRTMNWTAECVVGTNSWLVSETAPRWNSDQSWWFTGSNIVGSFIAKRFPERYRDLYERNHGKLPPAGQALGTTVFESEDGNPGRPARVQDLIPAMSGNVCWLAFCSGPALRREPRRIFPVSSLWKEYICADTGFPDQTTQFEDDLGLPSSLTLYTTGRQPVLQYRAVASTNVLGWDFPNEFHLAQYIPTGTNGWVLDLTVRGKLTLIAPGDEPKPPKAL